MSITRLYYAYAWNSPGYDIKRPGKCCFLSKFTPGFIQQSEKSEKINSLMSHAMMSKKNYHPSSYDHL